MCKRLLCLICVILVLSMSTIASAQLLVHYKFDETSGTVATDASGNGFDGTINGTATWEEGTLDGALKFSDTENVTLPAEDMGLYADLGSVAFWMRMDEPEGINTIFWGGDNTTGGGFGPENELHVHVESAVTDVWLGGELSFFIYANPNPNVHLHSDPDKSGADDPGAVPVNPILMGDWEWYHVAGIWDGDNGIAKMYIDGELIMEWEYESSGYALTNMYLGQMADGGRTYTGLLDDFRLYSHALTEEEVVALFNKEVVHVSDSPAAKPNEFALNQNYPNPFNPSTTISYTLPKAEHVNLQVYDVSGHLVATLVDGIQNAGTHTFTWNALDADQTKLASGVYIAKIKTESQTKSIRMLLMR